MRSKRITLLALLLFTSAASPALSASLTALGNLPGNRVSVAGGVSDDGSVVVGSSYSRLYDLGEAFRWLSASGMVGLGHLPGDLLTVASGVSGDGSVVVGSSGNQAYRWTADSGLIGLGDLPGGGFGSGASDVSGDGSVVVGTGRSASDYEAFRWTPDSGMIGLGDLRGGGFGSYGFGLSGDGSVVVGMGSGDSGSSPAEAFRWTSSGGMVGLGKLPRPDGGGSSRANGVSGDGSVVVGYSDSASGREAFRWTSSGGMVGLGGLPGEVGTVFSEAFGASGDGSVVVGELYFGGTAFQWTSAGGMERLWDVLLAHGVDPAADGWTSLASAYAISADGKTIVGEGRRYGNREAYVAVIPEPSSLALFGLGGAFLLRRRHRRQPEPPVCLSRD